MQEEKKDVQEERIEDAQDSKQKSGSKKEKQDRCDPCMHCGFHCKFLKNETEE